MLTTRWAMSPTFVITILGASKLRQPDPNLVTLTYVIYTLHLFSAISGLLSSALIVTAFLSGWPSLIAVLINYVKRSDVRGTWLDSHFSWQIRTFWFTLLWIVIAFVLTVTVVLIPIALVIAMMVGVWILYRMVRGLLRLNDGLPMPFTMPAQ